MLSTNLPSSPIDWSYVINDYDTKLFYVRWLWLSRGKSRSQPFVYFFSHSKGMSRKFMCGHHSTDHLSIICNFLIAHTRTLGLCTGGCGDTVSLSYDLEIIQYLTKIRRAMSYYPVDLRYSQLHLWTTLCNILDNSFQFNQGSREHLLSIRPTSMFIGSSHQI